MAGQEVEAPTFGDITARANAIPVDWSFEDDGPLFIGKWTGEMQSQETTFGTIYIATFKHLKTGEIRSLPLMHSVLKNRLCDIAPKEGETIIIRYKGQKTSPKTGRTFFDYSVERQKVIH